MRKSGEELHHQMTDVRQPEAISLACLDIEWRGPEEKPGRERIQTFLHGADMLLFPQWFYKCHLLVGEEEEGGGGGVRMKGAER